MTRRPRPLRVARAWTALTLAALPAIVVLGGAPTATTALVRRPGWTTTRLIASPHATQAAAADERHVYAISNTTVASYDRRTGALVRTGTAADAKHLNSGFVHDGLVYCAHSNYPAEPPESEIRVFDPESGELSLHYRFVDPPGSLVWCVRRGGNWWCCFAWYRAENARTVLVEYAAGGLREEVRRFTFPAAVVADWDGMSASGGIWDGDTLLVSHHHFPVLYRLALPESGGELRLVEALACPFPGQGIAADPCGGLVGIDRGCRRIVFADRE